MLASATNVNLGLRLCPPVIFGVLVWVVRAIGSLGFFLQPFQLLICIKFVPSFVVIAYCVLVSNQIRLSLLLYLLILLRCGYGLLFSLPDLNFLGFSLPLLIGLSELSFGLLLELHLLLPIVEISHVLSDLHRILLDFLLDLKTHQIMRYKSREGISSMVCDGYPLPKKWMGLAFVSRLRVIRLSSS